MIITESFEEEKEESTYKKKWEKKNKPPRVTGSTRCWICYYSIPLTDFDDPDIKIALHQQKRHNVPVPRYLKDIHEANLGGKTTRKSHGKKFNKKR